MIHASPTVTGSALCTGLKSGSAEPFHGGRGNDLAALCGIALRYKKVLRYHFTVRDRDGAHLPALDGLFDELHNAKLEHQAGSIWSIQDVLSQ